MRAPCSAGVSKAISSALLPTANDLVAVVVDACWLVDTAAAEASGAAHLAFWVQANDERIGIAVARQRVPTDVDGFVEMADTEDVTLFVQGNVEDCPGGTHLSKTLPRHFRHFPRWAMMNAVRVIIGSMV